MAALRAFHSLRTQKLDLVIEANVVLVPMTKEVASVADFRPISVTTPPEIILYYHLNHSI
jgi:hypothetical protein